MKGSSRAAELVRAKWEIRPRDGSPPLRGDLRALPGPPPKTAVVICHGFKGFKDWGFFPALASAIALAGHAAVSFNFSRSGIGEDGVDFSALDLFAENTYSRDVAEIGLVLDAIAGGALFPRTPSGIGLFGHSRGGGEAILAAARDARVDALVTWAAIGSVRRSSPEQVALWERGETVYVENARTKQRMPIGPSFWRDLLDHERELDVEGAAERLDIPWLIVHGDADETVSPEEGRRLFQVAGGSSELLEVEGAGHTFGAVHPYQGATPELGVALDATLRWFDRHL